MSRRSVHLLREPLRGLGALTRAYLLRSFREKTALFWNFAFPLFWLFAFAFIFGRGTADGVTWLMPGLFTITIVAISFAGVSYRVIGERERGILRRYRATPVGALAIVLANAAAALVILGISLVLLGVVARLAFGITVAGGILELVPVLLAGAVAFIPLGLIVGSVVTSQRAAPAVTNAIFFPLIFVSGAAIPFSLLPGWIQEIGRLLPATYLVEALHGVMVRGVGPGALVAPLTILAGTAVVAAGLDAYLFRWESREPVDRGRVAVAVGALGVLFVTIRGLAPPLRIAEEREEIRRRLEETVSVTAPYQLTGPAGAATRRRQSTIPATSPASATHWAGVRPA